MSLDSKFADLEIESNRRNKRRLSGLYRQIEPIVDVQEDCLSSSDSSINEIAEPNNENNPAQNNNNSTEEPNCPTVLLRRSGRKRISTTTFYSSLITGEYSNTRPKFARLATNANVQVPLVVQDEVVHVDHDPVEYLKQIYLDKTVKLKHNALETIFEEPKAVGKGRQQIAIMSGRKFRRFISFDESVSNVTKKTKKRSLKAKIITTKTRSKPKFNIKKKTELSPS